MRESKSRALPLGDAPIRSFNSSGGLAFNLTLQRRDVKPACYEGLPSARHLGSDRLRLLLRVELYKDASACSCQARLTIIGQPIQCIPHFRIEAAHHWFAVIADLTRSEGRHCDSA